MLRLKDLPNGSKLRLPTSSDGVNFADRNFIYDHPDGMYSYIFAEDDREVVVHLNLFTPMEKVGDHYEIKAPDPTP